MQLDSETQANLEASDRLLDLSVDGRILKSVYTHQMGDRTLAVVDATGGVHPVVLMPGSLRGLEEPVTLAHSGWTALATPVSEGFQLTDFGYAKYGEVEYELVEDEDWTLAEWILTKIAGRHGHLLLIVSAISRDALAKTDWAREGAARGRLTVASPVLAADRSGAVGFTPARIEPIPARPIDSYTSISIGRVPR